MLFSLWAWFYDEQVVVGPIVDGLELIWLQSFNSQKLKPGLFVPHSFFLLFVLSQINFFLLSLSLWGDSRIWNLDEFGANMVGLHYLGGFRYEVDFFAGTLFCFDVYICSLLLKTQLNEHETDRYFLQNFQCMTLLIDAFCKIFEHEIVLQECKSKRKQFQVHNSCKTCE